MKTSSEPDLIEEVEALLAKATPGPWSRSPAEPTIVQTAFTVVCDTAFGVSPPAWRIDNAELIAAAPELLRRLVDENKQLRAKLNDPCLVAGYHVCGGKHDLSDPWKGGDNR